VRDLTALINEVSDEVVGLGPIEFLLKDPEVSEVLLSIWGRAALVFRYRPGR